MEKFTCTGRSNGRTLEIIEVEAKTQAQAYYKASEYFETTYKPDAYVLMIKKSN